MRISKLRLRAGTAIWRPGIQEETARLAAEVKDRDGVGLRLRAGLNSGQVIAGEIGSSALGYTAIAEQVEMAERMESVPPPRMPAYRSVLHVGGGSERGRRGGE